MDRLDGPAKREHSVQLTTRSDLVISGVRHVDSFDDNHIVLDTEMGRLLVRGHTLKIQHLDLEAGDFAAVGEIDSMTYSQRAKSAGGRGAGWQKLWS